MPTGNANDELYSTTSDASAGSQPPEPILVVSRRSSRRESSPADAPPVRPSTHHSPDDETGSAVSSSSGTGVTSSSAAAGGVNESSFLNIRLAIRFCQLKPTSISAHGLDTILGAVHELSTFISESGATPISPTTAGAAAASSSELDETFSDVGTANYGNPLDISFVARGWLRHPHHAHVAAKSIRSIGHTLDGVQLTLPELAPLISKMKSFSNSDALNVATLAEQAADFVGDLPEYVDEVSVGDILAPYYGSCITIHRPWRAREVLSLLMDATTFLGIVAVVCLVCVEGYYLSLIPTIAALLLCTAGLLLQWGSGSPSLGLSCLALSNASLTLAYAVVCCQYIAPEILQFPLSLIPAAMCAAYLSRITSLPSRRMSAVFRTERGAAIQFFAVFYVSIYLVCLAFVLSNFLWRHAVLKDDQNSASVIVGELCIIAALCIFSVAGFDRESALAAAKRDSLELIVHVLRQQRQRASAGGAGGAPMQQQQQHPHTQLRPVPDVVTASGIPHHHSSTNSEDNYIPDSPVTSDFGAHRRSTVLPSVNVTKESSAHGIHQGGEMIVPVSVGGGRRQAEWRVPFDEIHSSSLIFAIDSAGEVVYWSAGLEQATQFMRNDLVGQSVLSVIPRPSDQSEIVAMTQYALRNGSCLQLVEVELMSRSAGRGVVSIAFAAYAARTAVNGGVFFFGIHSAAKVIGEVSEALAELQLKLASTSSSMSHAERVMMSEHISRVQRALPVDLAEVSVPEAIGRMICTQFSNRVIVSHFATDFPLTLALEADGFQAVVQQMLQHYTRRGGIALDAYIDPGNRKPTIRVVPDVRCAVWEPTVSAQAALRKCRGVLSTGEDDADRESLRGGCRLAFPADDDRRRSTSVTGGGGAHAATGDGIRCSVLLLDSNTVTATLIRRIVWERNHALFFVTDPAKLLMTLDGVDVLFVRVTATMGAGFVSAICAAKPELQIAVICQGVKIRTLPNVYLLEDPVLSQDIHNVMTECARSVMERRKSEKTVSDIRSILSAAKTCPWVRGKLLGRGTNATVYEATNVITKGKMAVRELRLNTSDPDELRATINDIVEEVKLMSAFEHKNIINYLYLERSELGLNIFMEYAPGGSIRSWLDRKGPAPLPQVALWLQDILEGLQYLHSQGVVHRDIKAANVLLAANGTCKLSDFGTAKKMSAGVTTTVEQVAGGAVGTLMFMSPEVVTNKPHDWHTDIWSLGCTVMEMLTGRMPFAHCIDSPLGAVRFLSNLKPDDVVPLPSAITDLNAVNFILCCLSVDPTHRPNCATLLNHPLLLQAARSRVAASPTSAAPIITRNAARRGKVVSASNTSTHLFDGDEDDASRRASAFSESSKSRASFATSVVFRGSGNST